MKTKLLLSLLLLTFFVNNLFSQEYFPMLNSSSWIVTVANFGGAENYTINQGADTVIGSYTYKQCFDPITNANIYLREDIATKKVYRNVSGTDQLLFDFSLQVNDVITLDNGLTYTVISISNVNVIGGTRRKFALNSGFFYDETWIEGVGNSQHPMRQSYEFPQDPYIYMICSAQNGVNIYNHNIASGSSTPTDCSAILSIEDLNYLKNQTTFTPNPFKTQLLISTNNRFENSTLKLYNAIGQLIKETQHIKGKQIVLQRDNLKSGIYFIQLSENGKTIATKKIIIAD